MVVRDDGLYNAIIDVHGLPELVCVAEFWLGVGAKSDGRGGGSPLPPPLGHPLPGTRGRHCLGHGTESLWGHRVRREHAVKFGHEPYGQNLLSSRLHAQVGWQLPSATPETPIATGVTTATPSATSIPTPSSVTAAFSTRPNELCVPWLVAVRDDGLYRTIIYDRGLPELVFVSGFWLGGGAHSYCGGGGSPLPLPLGHPLPCTRGRHILGHGRKPTWEYRVRREHVANFGHKPYGQKVQSPCLHAQMGWQHTTAAAVCPTATGAATATASATTLPTPSSVTAAFSTRPNELCVPWLVAVRDDGLYRTIIYDRGLPELVFVSGFWLGGGAHSYCGGGGSPLPLPLGHPLPCTRGRHILGHGRKPTWEYRVRREHVANFGHKP